MNWVVRSLALWMCASGRLRFKDVVSRLKLVVRQWQPAVQKWFHQPKWLADIGICLPLLSTRVLSRPRWISCAYLSLRGSPSCLGVDSLPHFLRITTSHSSFVRSILGFSLSSPSILNTNILDCCSGRSSEWISRIYS